MLSHASAAAAWGIRSFDAPFEIVTRPGNGGPERKEGVLICRSRKLESTTLDGIPITTPARHRGRRGTRRLHAAVSRYAGLPLHRTRSDAEALALEQLRDAGRPRPGVNERIGGEEADLSWPAWRLIVELDGPQFHVDASEDERRQAVWEAAGWTVRRVSTDDVYLDPQRLVAFATPPTEA